MKGFVKISKYAGMREDIVQAGGGNSSYKIASDKMAIKASGFQLADISEEQGYALVNPKIIRDAFMADDLDDITEPVSKEILGRAFIEGNRPSIETFLHAISGKYTLHTHPIVVNALTCRKNGEKILETLFPEALIVPYATPGVELAKAYFKAYKSKCKEEKDIFDCVFLLNHGLVVSGETPEQVIEKTENILRKIEEYLDVDYEEYHSLTEIWNLFHEKIIWKVTDLNIMQIYEKAGQMWEHCFCPDCVVFLGKKLLVLPEKYSSKDIECFREKYGEPVMISYNNQLYLVADSVKKALEIQSVMSFSAQVMDINANQECSLLSNEEQNFLLNWDAEKYRKQIR